MAAVDDVKSWMRFFGWTCGGGPGAVKTEYGGTIIARHGDATWKSDVESAIIRCERNRQDQMLMDEIEASLPESR